MPQTDPSDAGPGPGRRPFDTLTRRVVLTLFAVGGVALLAIWGLEWRNGTLNATNAVAYPAVAAVNAALLVALWRRPQLLKPVRWFGFLVVVTLLLVELVQETLQPTPMMGSYNAVTLLNWLPLTYALAFFLLEAEEAAWATAVILGFVGAMAIVRGRMAVPGASLDRDLLLNTFIAHAVLVVALTSMLWLKRVVVRQVEQAQQLRLLAGTDPLTGLANRRHALHLLERLVADRRADASPAVLLGDLDHFKRINDRLGHEMGDRVLCEVATALREHTRDSDTVARWGGEEFLVVLPRTGPGEADDLAERLRACIESLGVRDARGRPVPVTISLGIAGLAPRDNVAGWLRRADEALYRAKESGRNRCVDAAAAGVVDSRAGEDQGSGASVLDDA